MRNLTDVEMKLVSEIARRLAEPRRTQLLSDLASSLVEDQETTGARWTEFYIADYDRPQYEGQRSFGFNARLKDKDGATIILDLYADHNVRVLALELIRHDDGDIIEPDWASIEVSPNLP